MKLSLGNVPSKLVSICVIMLCCSWVLGCDQRSDDINDLPLDREISEVDLQCPCYGDKIILGSIGDASNLIPFLSTDSASHDISALIFDGLVRYNGDLKIVGNLAESWDILDNGLTLIFHLRKGVKWQDDEILTADDVLFTYQKIVDPDVPTAYEGDYLLVDEAIVPDKHTFVVKYKKPFAPALMSWSMGILPKHLLEKEDIVHTGFSRKPVGAGPYKLSQWLTGQKIILKVFEDYFKGRPYIDEVIYRIIPDSATMFLELKAGGIDMMSLTPLQFKRQTAYKKFEHMFNKYKYLSFSYTYLGFNLRNPLFSDKRVRQAVSYAINKEELVDGVLLGLGVVATGPYAPTSWAYNPHVKKYSYDPHKARKLLREAGWEDRDGDGIIEKGDHCFQFTILTNQGNVSRKMAAELIQRSLLEVGISTKIRILEWAAFISQFINKRRFDAVILGWTTGVDPDIYDIWHSSKTKEGELNFIGFKNKEVDRLLEEGRSTFDISVRKKCYYALQEILAEEQPYTFLYVPYALPVVHKRFQGITPAPAGIDYNFTEWYVPQKQQLYSR